MADFPLKETDIVDILSHRLTLYRDNISGFLSAINWTEPLLLGIIWFHLAMLALIILTKNKTSIQIATFSLLCIGVWSLPYLNTFAAAHWTQFATQPYFDESGLFASFTIGFPFFILGLIIVLMSLRNTVRLIIIAKRNEIRQLHQHAKCNNKTKDE